VNEFLQTALTFPTLAYSVVLAASVIYWALAATGLAEIDGVDGLLAGGDGDGNGAAPSAVAGMLATVGLGGVPIMVAVTLVAFFGWMGTYFVQLLLLHHLPLDTLRTLAGAGTALAMLIPAVLVSAMVVRPIRRAIATLKLSVQPTILGKVAIVSSPSVDTEYGTATLDDGGAGLILQVRADPAQHFARGDRVVLLEYVQERHAYRVIPENEFPSL
jgi:hypothetical protein